MYAVVKTGGKQYRVSEGQTFEVEKLAGNPGETINLDEVLLVADDNGVTLGRPRVEGARVEARVLGQDRHRKVLVFKLKRRKRYRRKVGHRQPFTALQVTAIHAGAQP